MCNLGRFGHLQKVLDTAATASQSLGLAQSDSNKRARIEPVVKQSTAHGIRLPALPPVIHAEQSLTERLLSVDDDERQQLAFTSETQILNGDGGLLLDDRLKNAIMSMKVGDAVSPKCSAVYARYQWTYKARHIESVTWAETIVF